MFSVHCETHGGRVLLGSRNIERLTNTPTGIELAWRCSCGSRGTTLTGRPAQATRRHDHDSVATAA